MLFTQIKSAILGEQGQMDIKAGEAFALWNFLQLRYLYLELKHIFKNYIEETEFGHGSTRHKQHPE